MPRPAPGVISGGCCCPQSRHALPLLQAVLVRISARLMRQSLQFTDERSKLEGELVGGIDVVKCSAWEVRPSLLLQFLTSLTFVPAVAKQP